MFAGNSGAYLSGVVLGWLTIGQDPGITFKHQTLKNTILNYDRKKFYNICLRTSPSLVGRCQWSMQRKSARYRNFNNLKQTSICQ
jgi:hypothetical protein